MTDIGVSRTEVEPIIRDYESASTALDTNLAAASPTSVVAGEASDAVAMLVFALTNGASTLSVYG